MSGLLGLPLHNSDGPPTDCLMLHMFQVIVATASCCTCSSHRPVTHFVHASTCSQAKCVLMVIRNAWTSIQQAVPLHRVISDELTSSTLAVSKLSCRMCGLCSTISRRLMSIHNECPRAGRLSFEDRESQIGVRSGHVHQDSLVHLRCNLMQLPRN